ncbi:solute carrier family 52, riboflavin transporter, member 2-like [Lampetra fluviatilis]
MRGRGVLEHSLVALFGMGSWVAVNALWVELPVMVKVLPESWDLASYLTVMVALANVGPIAVTITQRFAPGRLNERVLIHVIQVLAVVACACLAVTWSVTAPVSGRTHSVPYLVLAFALSFVCCTSNVTFLPHMYRFSTEHVKTFFVGQGLSALLPSVAALAQGVGAAECVNGTGNASAPALHVRYLEERFSVSAFFSVVCALLLASACAFAALVRLRPGAPAGEDLNPGQNENAILDDREEESQLKSDALSVASPESPASNGDVLMLPDRDRGRAVLAKRQQEEGESLCVGSVLYLLTLLLLSNALANGVLPSVQTYACLPYGGSVFHLSAVLSSIANPLACFLTMGLPCRSSPVLGLLFLLGVLVGSYIMTLAVLSPCPLLLGKPSGSVLVVLAWVLFVGLFSYLKVMIGTVLHQRGHAALLWCGAAIQAGSALGALAVFPLVNVYHLFTPGDPCSGSCPA